MCAGADVPTQQLAAGTTSFPLRTVSGVRRTSALFTTRSDALTTFDELQVSFLIQKFIDCTVSLLYRCM